VDHIAREWVEDANGVRDLAAHQEEQAVDGDGDDIVLSEQRHVLAVEAASGGVHEEAGVLSMGWVVEHDPVVRAEAAIQGVSRVVGGGAPVVADRAEVHVAVEVGGGEEASSDAVDEIERERGPGWSCHG
jgi:hypothetical protein